ncbi:hypothetical protein H5410_038173 [Solanum commersonii]|uniref:Uncharacterized protein n=1 Tax=Solanum commersonii TaxID=4109 RepID=A0A9J5YA09_SOLCO|nr:hypothetical protein H5410_038173 [Solanum commersonii]
MSAETKPVINSLTTSTWNSGKAYDFKPMDTQKKNQELKNEEAEVQAKLKMYLQKFKELESTVSLQEEEAAKNHVVDVSLIQKMVEDLEAEEDDVVEVNSKASGVDGHLQENQLSPPRPLLVHSTANGNGNSSAK